MTTDEMSVRVTPRRASSVASRLARAASVSRRMRPHRSISQLADSKVAKVVLSGSTKRGICLLAGARARAAEAVADLRKALRLRAVEDRRELVDPRGGDPKVAVIGQGFLYKRIEVRVAEPGPPRRTPAMLALRHFAPEAIGRGNLDRRLHIIRPLHAAAKQGRAKREAQDRPLGQSVAVNAHRQPLRRTCRTIAAAAPAATPGAQASVPAIPERTPPRAG